jgi:6,7-dimethyl-8-ribityllumazine synthase
VSTSEFSFSTLPYPLTKSNLKIGIAVANWNTEVTSLLQNGAVDTLLQNGLVDTQILITSIPGTFELPLACQWLFDQQCDAVIALGCVIRGETPHFDYVCKAATDGILQVGLKTNKPCIFGVLTTDNLQQALDRCGGNHGHKGKESAETALWMLALQQNL